MRETGRSAGGADMSTTDDSVSRFASLALLGGMLKELFEEAQAEPSTVRLGPGDKQRLETLESLVNASARAAWRASSSDNFVPDAVIPRTLAEERQIYDLIKSLATDRTIDQPFLDWSLAAQAAL